MKTFIINNHWLLCAENEVVARNLAECKYDCEIFSVEVFAQ